MVYTIEHARRVLEVVNAGLVQGLGKPSPGEMCVEAAICYALGLPHGDDPLCVALAVRKFEIILNDANWSSHMARAQGMRALAVAQLGSKGVVQNTAFSQNLAHDTIQQLLPLTLRSVAAVVSEPHRSRIMASALWCEHDGSAAAARAAGDAVEAAMDVAGGTEAAAWAGAAAAALRAASAAAWAAEGAVGNVRRGGAEEAAGVAAAAWAAGAAEEAEARAVGGVAGRAADTMLVLSANLALDILRKLGAPGIVLWDAVKGSAP